MNGVTILDTIDIYQVSVWQALLGIAPLIISFIIFSVRLYRAFKKGTEEDRAMGVVSSEHWKPKELLIVAVGGMITFALMFSFEKFCPAEYVETQYEVSIDETVSFTEFYDKYEVVEERDNSFIVKDRTN